MKWMTRGNNSVELTVCINGSAGVTEWQDKVVTFGRYVCDLKFKTNSQQLAANSNKKKNNWKCSQIVETTLQSGATYHPHEIICCSTGRVNDTYWTHDYSHFIPLCDDAIALFIVNKLEHRRERSSLWRFCAISLKKGCSHFELVARARLDK